jgi:hypothetical protein
MDVLEDLDELGVPNRTQQDVGVVDLEFVHRTSRAHERVRDRVEVAAQEKGKQHFDEPWEVRRRRPRLAGRAPRVTAVCPQ